MNTILHLVIFILCTKWFHEKLKKTNNEVIFPIIIVYLIASIISLVLSVIVQAEFLDGILYLVVSGSFSVLFWVITTWFIVKVNRANNTAALIPFMLSQNALLLAYPFVVWLILSNSSFNIGG